MRITHLTFYIVNGSVKQINSSSSFCNSTDNCEILLRFHFYWYRQLFLSSEIIKLEIQLWI